MKHFVNRGHTIQLNWTLHSISGQEFALTGHTYKLFFATGNQSAQATGVTHSGNVLSWTFTPNAQWKLGSYTIWLEVYNNGTKIITVSYPDAFHLVHEVAASGTTQTGSQTSSTTLNLVSSCDFYRFAPVVPVAGDDGYWYVNGAKAVDGNGEYILTSHTFEYDEDTKNFIIDRGRVDSEGNSIEQVITALADLDSYYQAAEGSEAGSEAGDGSRWGSYKTAEAARNAARETAEGTSSATAGDGTRWGAYKTAEAARNTAGQTAEGTSSSEAGDGSRWGAYKSAEAERNSAFETSTGNLIEETTAAAEAASGAASDANTAASRANTAAAEAEAIVDTHRGPEGKSAYQIAVEEGFTGTEAEWLESIEGTGIDDVEQTETSIANGGTNKVRITLTDGTYYDIQIKNGSSSNGLFPTSSALAAACPSPKVGDYAFVGDGFPADIYVCETAGTWTDSGEDFDGGSVDLTDYSKKAEVGDISDLKTQDTSNVVAAINEVAARHGFPTDAAELLVSILRRAVYTTDDVKADIDALEEEIVIYNLASITAVFTPGDKTFYVGESVEDLRPYLVVKAVYEDETEETINNYTLHGAFVDGTGTITIKYHGESTTISVTAEDAVYYRDTFVNKLQLAYKWTASTRHPATIDGVVYYFTRIAYTGQTTPNRRCSYYLFDLDLEEGKTYDFLFRIDGLSNDAIVSTGLQFHDAVFKAAGIANEYQASADYESHLNDSTWQLLTLDNGYYTKRYTCPAGMVGVRPCLKLGNSDTTNWPDTAIVKEFIIKEVSNE